MNLTILIVWVVLAVVVLILIAGHKSNPGERHVAHKLDWLPSGKYHVFNDLILPKRNSTTQIDHVVVSQYGIFVIETKNYKGIITGSEISEKWTQHLYTKKNQLYNPVKQNRGHIHAIRNIIRKVYDGEIISIIAFSGTAKLNVYVESAHVVYARQLRRCIRQYRKTRMSEVQMLEVIRRIKEANITDKKIRRQHTKNVQAYVRKREEDIANLICPQCGSRLVRREGKFGLFYGCSNFPRCKFTTK